MTFPVCGTSGGPWEAGTGAGGGTEDMPLDPGEGVREGVVEDGRIHPAPVLVEDDGNFASLASTRRECDVGGGGGDLAEPFIGKVKTDHEHQLY
jgi:hypothetical protein